MTHETLFLFDSVLYNLGRSYIEANEALASVNIPECCQKTFLYR